MQGVCASMTTETQDQDIAQAAELLGSLRNSITDLRHEIEGLAKEAQSTGTTKEAETKQALGKIRDLVTQCTKAEIFLNECRNKQTGIARGGYALDLGRARVEIGCKLDRLRRCGPARGIPE